MLATLVSIVNFLKTTFYYGLYISSKTGNFIVSLALYTLEYLNRFLGNVFGVFTVISESLVIFLQDILQFIQQFLQFFTSSIEAVCNSVLLLLSKISLSVEAVISFLTAVFSFIWQGISNIYFCLIQTFVLIKKLIILFGSGVWFLITLVPFLLYYTCVIFVSFIQKIYREICDICYNTFSNIEKCIKNMIFFIIDVPLESIAGIIVALSLAYIFSQFYIIIMSYVKLQVRKSKRWFQRRSREFREMILYNYAAIQRWRIQHGTTAAPPIVQRTPEINARVQGRPSTRTVAQEKNNHLTEEERFCVICQERTKCVLLLPCRHLCLCSECTRELRYYNEVCPVCRTDIESTMKIFV